MITQETVDKILGAAHIEEVVSDFVKLKKRGVNYLGLCPFHNEKTPSFTVSPNKEIYKCFGCGKAGNSVNFIMEHEHLSYPEALRYLADKYKIPVEETYKPEEKEQKTERESMYILLSAAQKYFTEQLFESEEGKTIALPYLKERELSKDTIHTFGLGWAPSGREIFSQYALKAGYSREMLIRTGLSYESERDNKLYDRFHGRIIFPIHNVSGKVVGFGGRILKSTGKEAKYINSPETEVYQKSKILYGMSQAKKAVRQQDECIVVEGYIDVLSMFQNGIENVVATSGTSLTTEQLKLMKRFTENVVFLFDGDPAGQKAALRGLDMALEEGLNVRTASLPAEDDPDTFARKHKQEEIETYLKENAKNFVRFRYDLFGEEAEKDPVKKAGLVKEILQSIAYVPDSIKRSLFVREAASLLAMSEEMLYQELRRITVSKYKEENRPHEIEIALPAAPEQETKLIPRTTSSHQERRVVRNLLLYGAQLFSETQSVSHYICDELTEIQWRDQVCEEVFERFCKAIEAGEVTPDYRLFFSEGNAELQNFVSGLIVEPYDIANWEKFIHRKVEIDYKAEVISSLEYIKLHKIMEMLEEVDVQLKESEGPEKDDELLLVKIHLIEMKKTISSALGITVVKG